MTPMTHQRLRGYTHERTITHSASFMHCYCAGLLSGGNLLPAFGLLAVSQNVLADKRSYLAGLVGVNGLF
jgi:hypothetical protein